ncbi:unnamed protein product, partial [Protopolystoma xenopodis]
MFNLLPPSVVIHYASVNRASKVAEGDKQSLLRQAKATAASDFCAVVPGTQTQECLCPWDHSNLPTSYSKFCKVEIPCDAYVCLTMVRISSNNSAKDEIGYSLSVKSWDWLNSPLFPNIPSMPYNLSKFLVGSPNNLPQNQNMNPMVSNLGLPPTFLLRLSLDPKISPGGAFGLPDDRTLSGLSRESSI